MDQDNEQAKRLAQSEKVRELIKSDTFQELLQLLALKVRELNTANSI